MQRKLDKTESSSKGNQPKYLKEEFWYKEDRLGYEALSEFIVSQVLKITPKINCITYNIVKINNKLFSYSKNFLQQDEVLISVHKLAKQYNIDLYKIFENKSTVEKISFVIDLVTKITGLQNFPQHLANLLYIDKIFLNEDRHLANIAFIYEMNTNKFKLAPIFDNGAALLSDIQNDYPINFKITAASLRKIKSKPFTTDFGKQCKAMDSICKPNIIIQYDMKDIENLVNVTPYSEIIKKRVITILNLQKSILL